MHKMTAAGATLALLFSLVPAAPAADSLEKVKQGGVLVVGVAEDEPPFGFRDRYSGQLSGYDVDVVNGIANRLGVRVRLKAVTEGDRLSELLDGGIDLIAAGLTQTDARSSVLDFSDAYLVSGQKLIAPTGSIRRQEDLVGKRIGTVVGTFAEACVRGQCVASVIVPFDDYIDGLRALQKGEVDAFTADEAILVDLYQGLQGGGYEIPDVFILREEFYLGVRKGDRELLEAVNQALAAMERDGEAERIHAKWLAPQEVLPPPAYGSVVRKAAAPPRFLGIVLNGLLYPEEEVSLFALNGEYVGKGWISSVLGDEFYVDVEPRIYDLVRPGFLVAMNMNREMAMDVLMRRRNVLETVKEEADERAQEVRSEIRAEAKAKEERAIEMDTYRERINAAARAVDRSRDDRYRYYYRYRRRYRR